MKLSLNIAAIALLSIGSIWLLQGINILPGSFMTGQRQWAIIGAAVIACGIALLLLTNRKRNP